MHLILSEYQYYDMDEHYVVIISDQILTKVLGEKLMPSF